MRMVFIEKVSGVTAKLAVLDCRSQLQQLQHPLIARLLGKTICYEKYLDLSKLNFFFERTRSLQGFFWKFEGHLIQTQIVCIRFYQFDVFSGPDPYETCIFPFTYNGVTFNTCTGLHFDAVCLIVSNIWNCTYEIHIQDWCSTAVDENGVHITGSYGYCGPDCPTEDDVDVSECAASLTHQSDADTDTPK